MGRRFINGTVEGDDGKRRHEQRVFEVRGESWQDAVCQHCLATFRGKQSRLHSADSMWTAVRNEQDELLHVVKELTR